MEKIQHWLRSPERTETIVGRGGIITIVDGEVHVIQRVMRGAVDELLCPMARSRVTVLNQDSPDLNRNEEEQVQISLRWANDDGDASEFQMMMAIRGNSDDRLGHSLVWQRLHIAIKRVKSQRSPWRGNCYVVSIGTCRYWKARSRCEVLWEVVGRDLQIHL